MMLVKFNLTFYSQHFFHNDFLFQLILSCIQFDEFCLAFLDCCNNSTISRVNFEPKYEIRSESFFYGEIFSLKSERSKSVRSHLNCVYIFLDFLCFFLFSVIIQ